MQKHLDQRQNLKFLVAEGHTPIQCWHKLLRVYSEEETMSKPTVRRWHKRFLEGDGHTPVTDLERSGRPRTQTTPEKVEAVQCLIMTNGRKTCATTAAETQMSRATAHKILKKELKMSRKVAKFVPKLLNEDQKRMRVQCATQNLDRLKADPYLLDKLVCGDESPVYLHDPENKFESSAWLPVGHLHPVKALRYRSQKRTMLTVFFDSLGEILVEFTEETIDSEAYIATLRRLRERICKKRPGMWTGGVDGSTDREFVIQHNNANPHTSNMTLGFLFDQDLLTHPPYSPDLAPCNFWLFPLLKARLRGINHRNLPELKKSVRKVIRDIPEQSFQEALCKLPMRWRKCVASGGEYFEGHGVEPAEDPYFDMPLEAETDSDQEEP